MTLYLLKGAILIKKNKAILCFLIISLILLVTVLMINTRKQIIFIKGQKLNSSYIFIYTFDDGSKVYTQFPDIEYINESGKKENLEQSLKKDKTIIDKIVAKTPKMNALNDGGSKIYYFDKKYANKSFDIVKCNNKDGIKDIYIVENADSIIDKICVKR